MLAPPSSAFQTVIRWVGSKERLRKCVLFPAEASRQTPAGPPGTAAIAQTRTATIPPHSTRNCTVSVQMTAFIPPRAVYNVAARPVQTTACHSCQSVIAVMARAGA